MSRSLCRWSHTMLSGRIIALVEDDEIMGASIQQRLLLEGRGYLAPDAGARPACDRTPRRRFDAVVCDIRLPDGTGEDLFMTLLCTSSPPPFLFVTGQGEVAQAVRMLRSGAADYLTKPFDMRVFLDRLAQVAAARPGPPCPKPASAARPARWTGRWPMRHGRRSRC